MLAIMKQNNRIAVEVGWLSIYECLCYVISSDLFVEINIKYWKVSGLRVSYDSVVSVDWADDGMVEDVILQGGKNRKSTNNQSAPWISD